MEEGRRAMRTGVEDLERRVMLTGILHSFSGVDGGGPTSNLIKDSNGNLYGTTTTGGDSGLGTVFELSADASTIKTLVSFNGSNGATPEGGLFINSSGYIYGTTSAGGSNNFGTIFKIASGSTAVQTVASFNGTNGSSPRGSLLLDNYGRLLGATWSGGVGNLGTVYEFDGTKILTLFSLGQFGTTLGTNASGHLTLDSSGNVWGTTATGGVNGEGAVFEILVSSGGFQYMLPLSFNGTNGAAPMGGLTTDVSGNLFGTTSGGGANGNGTVFEVKSGSNGITSLASFNGSNGASPLGEVPLDTVGNIYGTTSAGGANGMGSIFQLSGGNHLLSVVHSFSGADGSSPQGGILLDQLGEVECTTSAGGVNGEGGIYQSASAATVYHLEFLQQPTTVTAGQVGVVQVGIFDQTETIVTGGLQNVTLSGAAIYGAGTTALSQQGVATFNNLVFSKAGTNKIFAEVDQLGLKGFVSQAITVTPGPVGQLFVDYGYEDPSPTEGAADKPLPPVSVQLLDNSGNLVTKSNANVTLKVASGPGAITGTTTVRAVNGIATFSNAFLRISGDYTLTAADIDDGIAVANPSHLFFVIFGPITQMAFTKLPSTIVAGTPATIAAAFGDGFGNIPFSQDQVALSIQSGPAGATILGNATVRASNGVATFSNISLSKSGSYVLAARDESNGTLTAVSTSFTVIAGNATQVAFQQLPMDNQAGHAITVNVAAEDVFGNVCTTNQGMAQLSIVGRSCERRSARGLRECCQWCDCFRREGYGCGKLCAGGFGGEFDDGERNDHPWRGHGPHENDRVAAAGERCCGAGVWAAGGVDR